MSEAEYQALTDKIYADYVSMMKSKGNEILSEESHKGDKAFTKAELMTGGSMDYSSKGGYVYTIPTGYNYLIS